ncbi:MAG TPA: YjgN family protein [Xanthomonadaceae bacterium]|nr:YjgN family protein [Xanthomonadaceae bacterium]
MHEATAGSIEPVISSFDLTAVWQARSRDTRYKVEFIGDAGEYFRIWIVNLALSIVTLGIYSAWAKVRTKRYFYANTRLAGSSFEYLAQPLQILKGRLIAYSLVIALWSSLHFQVLPVYFSLLALVVLLMPWVIYRTLAFRARYSAWRGLRFRFTGGAGDAYSNYFFRPMVLPFTLYLTYPWVRMKQHDYIVSGHRFGGKRFQFADNTEGYFGPFFVMFGLGIIGYVIAVMMFVAMMPHHVYGEPRPVAPPAGFYAIMALVYGGVIALRTFLGTRYHNVMWAHTKLGLHRFECSLSARTMIWLYLTNAIAIVCTLGMAIPWAMVRLARYRAEKFTVVAADSLDNFVAESAQAEGAAGAEILGALDMDFDIGL